MLAALGFLAWCRLEIVLRGAIIDDNTERDSGVQEDCPSGLLHVCKLGKVFFFEVRR